MKSSCKYIFISYRRTNKRHDVPTPEYIGVEQSVNVATRVASGESCEYVERCDHMVRGKKRGSEKGGDFDSHWSPTVKEEDLLHQAKV